MKQRSRNCTKVKSSTRKDVTVYARKVHFKNIEEAHELCGEMIGNVDKFSPTQFVLPTLTYVLLP